MNTSSVNVLLKEQADRQKTADILLARTRADRLMRWLPSAGLVAAVAWDAWMGADRPRYGLLAAIGAANLISLTLAQGMATRRLNAIATVLQRSAALDAFLTSDRVRSQVATGHER